MSSRILLVEDNTDCAEALALFLRLHDHEVQVAFNGQHALAMLDEFIPDLIILDLMMPIMDGLQFLQRLRRYEQFKKTPVIIFTGADRMLRTAELMSLGVQELLFKNGVDFDRVLEAATAATRTPVEDDLP